MRLVGEFAARRRDGIGARGKRSGQRTQLLGAERGRKACDQIDELPPGDRAALFLDGANKAVMVGIIDRDWVCARFAAPDSLVNLIIEVGRARSSEPDSPREDRGSSQ